MGSGGDHLLLCERDGVKEGLHRGLAKAPAALMRPVLVVQHGLRTPTGPLSAKFSIGGIRRTTADAGLPISTHHHPAAAQCSGNAGGLDHTLRRNCNWWRIAFPPTTVQRQTCMQHAKTLVRAPRFGHGLSQDAARCRSRQARGTSLTNRGLLTEETMTAHLAPARPIAPAQAAIFC